MNMRQALSFFLAIFSLTIVWFWPNIYGQYRFKQYCEREGGLKVYGKVLPNQGWLAEGTSPGDYELPFALKHVAFVRYQDKAGARFDVYAKPNPWPRVGPDYIFQPVDETKSPRYQLQRTSEFVTGELRLAKTQYVIISLPEHQVLASYTGFGYSQFDQNKTLLGAPSGVKCPDDDSKARFFKRIFN